MHSHSMACRWTQGLETHLQVEVLGQDGLPIAGFLAGKVGEGELRSPELPALRVSHAPRRPVLPQDPSGTSL